MKVLFLCHANMCRSPLAEGLLRHILKLNNNEAEGDSAGFEAYQNNESPDDRAVSKARERGIDISKRRVRLFTREDFDLFDKIYVMDTLAYRNALYFARDENDRMKVDDLMNVINPGRNESIPDPFFRSTTVTDETFDLLHKACSRIAEDMTNLQLN